MIICKDIYFHAKKQNKTNYISLKNKVFAKDIPTIFLVSDWRTLRLNHLEQNSSDFLFRKKLANIIETLNRFNFLGSKYPNGKELIYSSFNADIEPAYKLIVSNRVTSALNSFKVSSLITNTCF